MSPLEINVIVAMVALAIGFGLGYLTAFLKCVAVILEPRKPS